MKKHRPKQGRRKELKTQLAAITEDIEELRFEEKDIMQGFDKEDAAGMKQVKSEISGAEADMVRLGKDETTLSEAIEKEREKFSGLKEQAAVLDRDGLTDARLALRPQMEAQAKDRIRGAMSSGKVDFWKLLTCIQDTDKLLASDGLAERREHSKRQRERENTFKMSHRKLRSHDSER